MLPISMVLGAKSISRARVARLMNFIVIRGVMRMGTWAVSASRMTFFIGNALKEGSEIALQRWQDERDSLGEQPR